MSQIDDDDDLQEEQEPTPRTSTLTIVLCVLNLLAVFGFVMLLLMTLSRRQQWAYRVYLHDLAILGLPLEEDREGYSDAQDLASHPSLDPAWLKEAYQARVSKGG